MGVALGGAAEQTFAQEDALNPYPLRPPKPVKRARAGSGDTLGWATNNSRSLVSASRS
jgi:hypothetical protein